MATTTLSNIILCVCFALGAHGSTTQVEVTLGRTATLPCSVDFSGDPVVVWTSPEGNTLTRGTEVIHHDDRFSVDHYFKDWNLEIEDVKKSDEGEYTCRISASSNWRKTVALRVLTAPTITYTSGDPSTDTGNDISLTCVAEGSPTPQMSWYRYTYTGHREDLHHSEDTLMITNATRSDAGTYECIANNTVPPNAMATIRVDIKFAPIVTLPHQHISQEYGRDTVLQCLVTSNPHNDPYWQRDGTPIEDSDKYRVTRQDAEHYNKSVFLFVYDLQAPDFGVYDCVAENQFGRANGSVQLFEWQSGHIRLDAPPKDAIVSMATDVRINCSVQNMQQKDSVAWWRSDPQGGYYRIFESHPAVSGASPRSPVYLDSDKYEVEGHYNLVVKEVGVEDAGEYMCEIVGRRNHSAFLTVTDDLVCILESSANDSWVSEGSMAVLGCSMNLSGHQRVWHAVWEHIDRKISGIDEDEGATYLHRTASFPAFPSDSGLYTCVISSQEPPYISQCSLELSVTDKELYTPLPVAEEDKEDPWDLDSSVVAVIVGASVGGTALLFSILLVGVCCHYRRKNKQTRQVASDEQNAHANSSAVQYHRNGSINLERSHLTSKEATDPEV